MGKKNLDDILIKNDSVLPTAKKPAKERESEYVTIKITPTEKAILVEKKEREEGKMAPLGTYLKYFLRTKTKLFERDK